MSLAVLIQVLLKNLLVFVFFSIMGLTWALHTNNTSIPMYKSNTQLFVSTPLSSIDIVTLQQGSSFGSQRVKSYAEIINSSDTMAKVIARLKLPFSPEQLSNQVSATSPVETVLINVSVVNSDPKLAQKIAEAVGDEFTSTVSRLETFSQGSSPISVSVVKTATLPATPFSPKKLVNNLVGVVSGISLALLFSLIRFLTDTRIKNSGHLVGTSVVARFPKLRRKELGEIILNADHNLSRRTETYRQLRSHILARNGLDTSRKLTNVSLTIGICSANPAEGKTTTSINLGIIFANMGLRTVIVETDVRLPSLERNLQSSGYLPSDYVNAQGFTQFLMDEKYLIRNTANEKLSILSCGKIDTKAIELIDSKRIRALIKKLKLNHDVIIFDTAPLLSVADGTALLSQCDEILHVVKAGCTHVSEFKRCSEIYVEQGATLTGVIMNMMPRRDFSNQYGYGYGYGYVYGSRNRYGYGYSRGYVYGSPKVKKKNLKIGTKKRIANSGLRFVEIVLTVGKIVRNHSDSFFQKRKVANRSAKVVLKEEESISLILDKIMSDVKSKKK